MSASLWNTSAKLTSHTLNAWNKRLMYTINDEDGIGETALSYDLPELLLSPTLLMTDETIEYVERGRKVAYY